MVLSFGTEHGLVRQEQAHAVGIATRLGQDAIWSSSFFTSMTETLWSSLCECLLSEFQQRCLF